jgi:hypothetical protein
MNLNSLVASLGRLTFQNLPGVKFSSTRALSTSLSNNSLFGTSLLNGGGVVGGIICPGHAWAVGSVGVASKLISDMQVRYRRVYKTRSRRFDGIVDVYGEEDGKRQPLPAAEERFKRLDWGIYIRTR